MQRDRHPEDAETLAPRHITEVEHRVEVTHCYGEHEVSGYGKDCTLDGHCAPIVEVSQQVDDVFRTGKSHAYAAGIHNAVNTFVEIRVLAQQEPEHQQFD